MKVLQHDQAAALLHAADADAVEVLVVDDDLGRRLAQRVAREHERHAHVVVLETRDRRRDRLAVVIGFRLAMARPGPLRIVRRCREKPLNAGVRKIRRLERAELARAVDQMKESRPRCRSARPDTGPRPANRDHCLSSSAVGPAISAPARHGARLRAADRRGPCADAHHSAPRLEGGGDDVCPTRGVGARPPCTL
jgi:hypothetical protein